jgi:hypothetical protein
MSSLYSRFSLVSLLLVFISFSSGYSTRGVLANTNAITGTVHGLDGPISEAHVRVRAAQDLTLTNSHGEFTINGLTPGVEIELTAWSEGYYVASLLVTPPASGIIFNLRTYHTTDRETYTWASPIPGTSEKACGDCHPKIIPQWQANAHAGAISNPRFYSMYNGTDTSGTVQVAPGYTDDFPGTSGNCASCHAPGAAVDGYMTTNMNAVRDELTSGIHCDYCHKVGGVFADPATASVYPNSPGVSSQRILRPPEGDEIFFGPFDDIPDPDTYLPLIAESLFCAPCHQFSFWGTPIYESFNEWLASPYAEAGITCQDCHMPPNGDTDYAPPEVGGLQHPPETIPSHLQLGASSDQLLQNSVELSTEIKQVGSRLVVSVEIANTQAGHHVPTDHPGRHLILTVELHGESGQPLTRLYGPQVPAWGGIQAGEPGKVYAKILRDLESGQYPVVSYWKQTGLVSDNRIPAGESDLSHYTFIAPGVGEAVTLDVELRFRRLFYDELTGRDWDTPDVIMEQAINSITIEPWWEYYLPLTTAK